MNDCMYAEENKDYPIQNIRHSVVVQTITGNITTYSQVLVIDGPVA